MFALVLGRRLVIIGIGVATLGILLGSPLGFPVFRLDEPGSFAWTNFYITATLGMTLIGLLTAVIGTGILACRVGVAPLLKSALGVALVGFVVFESLSHNFAPLDPIYMFTLLFATIATVGLIVVIVAVRFISRG
jgi:hypothetical protein